MRAVDIANLTFDGLIDREWLVSNGSGGFACSTLCGMNTRKYHGLLVAAMTPPVRRMVMLSHVEESVLIDGGNYALSCNEYPGTVYPQGHRLLRAFSAEPFPRWAYQSEGFTIEKSLRLLQHENTVCLTYSLLGGDKPIELEIRPLLALRPIHELMYQWNARLAAEIKSPGKVRIAPTIKTPELFFVHDGEFAAESYWYLNTIYRREEERGYGGLEDLWNPGTFRWKMSPGQTIHLVCSTEPVELDRVLHDMHTDTLGISFPRGLDHDANYDLLVRAASAVVATAPAESSSQLPVAVIGQYPWSAPSGRAALIGFTGLFLVPGRFDEAKKLLQYFAGALVDGLMPTEFSESGGQPGYNGADTSLWFINAVNDYLRYTSDEATVQSLLPAIETIVEAYRRGTKLGIECDEVGLIASRAGIPTSWMDAQLNDWIVTPRQGQTVELNALWFNALKIAAALSVQSGHESPAADYHRLAESVRLAFNNQFWHAEQNCCFDVIDHQNFDASIRPNQLLACSLAYPVLDADRRESVIRTVVAMLLTPQGVRTLSPRDAAYQGRYGGNVISRDRAQHQGSVYPWLLGPLVTAFLRINGRAAPHIATAHGWLQKSLDYLQSDGIGQICELFDGDAPQKPGGAIASALSVAEILRCYAQDILGLVPGAPGWKPMEFRAIPAGAAGAPRR
jgi:predicted glycogen debranching enzyme